MFNFRWIPCVLAALAISGCEGVVTTPAGKAPVPLPIAELPKDACAQIEVAAGLTSLRRLSTEEQRNSFRDLLADATLTPALAPVNGPVITEAEVEKLNLAVAALVATNKHLTFSNGSVHLGMDMPFLLAGKGGHPTLQTGRYVNHNTKAATNDFTGLYASTATTNNLYTSVLNVLGFNDTAFGDMAYAKTPGALSGVL